jgi:hypothetical protein
MVFPEQWEIAYLFAKIQDNNIKTNKRYYSGNRELMFHNGKPFYFKKILNLNGKFVLQCEKKTKTCSLKMNKF